MLGLLSVKYTVWQISIVPDLSVFDLHQTRLSMNVSMLTSVDIPSVILCRQGLERLFKYLGNVFVFLLVLYIALPCAFVWELFSKLVAP